MSKLLRATEVADRLGCHVIHVYRLGRTGIFDTFPIGAKGIRFSESQVEKYIESRRINRGSTIKAGQ